MRKPFGGVINDVQNIVTKKKVDIIPKKWYKNGFGTKKGIALIIGAIVTGVIGTISIAKNMYINGLEEFEDAEYKALDEAGIFIDNEEEDEG